MNVNSILVDLELVLILKEVSVVIVRMVFYKVNFHLSNVKRVIVDLILVMNLEPVLILTNVDQNLVDMEAVQTILAVLTVLVQMAFRKVKEGNNVRHVMLDFNLKVNLEHVEMSTNVN